jgi:hypothetical protein
MNNLRTVTRLGVDKFISKSMEAEVFFSAYELANTLRLGRKKSIISPSLI